MSKIVGTFRQIVVALFRDGTEEKAKRAHTAQEAGITTWFNNEKELLTALEPTRGDFGDRVLLLRPPAGLSNGPWSSFRQPPKRRDR